MTEFNAQPNMTGANTTNSVFPKSEATKPEAKEQEKPIEVVVVKTAEQMIRKVKEVPFDKKEFLLLTDLKTDNGTIAKGSRIKLSKAMYDHLIQYNAVEEIPVYE